MSAEKQSPALPHVGLFACFSGGSNTGSLAGMAALEVVRRLGDDVVGICSLPAVLNQVPRQSALIRRLEKLVADAISELVRRCDRSDGSAKGSRSMAVSQTNIRWAAGHGKTTGERATC